MHLITPKQESASNYSDMKRAPPDLGIRFEPTIML